MPDSLEDNTSCRICMDSTDSYVSLFTHDLSVKVMEVADVQVDKDDGLPETICTQCETDLEKCYEFRLKVQVSDKRFRDNIKYSKVDIEECNIKEEREMDDGNSDNLDDKDSIIMDDDNCNDEPDVVLKNTEEIEEPEPDPMNHVVVIEEKERKVDISEDPDPLRQDEAMMEVLQVKKVEEPPVDPFVCMKEETEIMDIESLEPETFGPSSSVRSTELSSSCPVLTPAISSRIVTVNNEFDMEINQQPKASSNIGSNIVFTSRAINYLGNIPGYTFRSHENIQNQNISMHLIMTTEPIFGSTVYPKTNSKTQENKQTPSAEVEMVKETVIESKDSKIIQSSSLSHPTHEGVNPKGENEFFCSVCNVDCGSSDLLDEHKNETEFICRACAAIFNNHQELESHFFSHQRKFTCEFCKKSFCIRKDLYDHKKTVVKCNKNPTKVRCKLCGNRYVHKSSFETHMKEKHADSEKGFTCPVCKRDFKKIVNFKNHMIVSHAAYENVECDICHKIFSGPNTLKAHIKARHLHPSEVCPICKKVLSCKRSLKSHMESHSGKEIVCDICGAVSKGEVAFKYHMYGHDNRRHSCDICNETFNTRNEKQRHRIKKHRSSTTNSISAMCELCGKVFKSMVILKNHMMFKHSNEKSYKCGDCGAAFKTKTILLTHSRIHSDVKKYSCNNCGKGFRWRSTFGKHLLKCESS